MLVRSPYVIALSAAERKRLKKLARKATAPHRQVVRAGIVLAASAGLTNAAIAAKWSIHIETVRRWRRRFCAEGEAGLADRPRAGRPRVYGPEDRIKIVATVTKQSPQEKGQETGRVGSHWSHTLIAEHLRQEVGISAAQVGRILADLDIKPHRVRGWLTRPKDDAFFAKAAAVCGLYLHRPPNAVVLSIDEKTAITARSRKHPSTPARPGRYARQEFEYIRHGTVSLMAALDVHTGQVRGRIIERNNSETFINFLTEIDQDIDPGLDIYLVLDNGSSHVSKATKAWLAAHPRFKATYTPKHASWLNQIELFFSILTRQLLRRGEFASRQELADSTLHYITSYNHTAKPYRWTYDGSPLKAA